MDFLTQTDYDPQTLARSPKLESSRLNQCLNQSLLQQDQSKIFHTNNMSFKNNLKEQPIDNESNGSENLTNQNCDEALTRRIDQNTELKIYLKNRSIYITVIQVAPDQMNDILTEQEDSSNRNNINIYKGKVKSLNMDGYMKGLFYDVVSLFVHLKLTDQIQFNVVKNQKKIITLLDNSDVSQNKFQNQEYFEYFLNFYMNQVLPGDRMVKRSCSINLSKIDTEPKHIKQIKQSRWKKQAQKIEELTEKIAQLEEKLYIQQERVKKYKLKNEKLRGFIKYLNDKSQYLSKQKDKNVDMLDEQDIYFDQELEKKYRVLEKKNRKEQQNILQSKCQILSISIDSTPQKMKIKLQPDTQEIKPKQQQKQSIKQNTISPEGQFIIRVKNLKKKNSRQKHIKPITTLQKKNQKIMQEKQKRVEQINYNSIASSKTKQTQNHENSSSGHRTIQKLNNIFRNLQQPSQQKNLIDKKNSSKQGKDKSTSKLGLINKYISSKGKPRKIQITGDSYLKISKQVQLISVPCSFLIIRFQEVTIFLYRVLPWILEIESLNTKYVNSILYLVREIAPLAQSIKNNKNVTQHISMLTIEHSHAFGVYQGEFQPLVDVINNHLLNLQKVIIKYPSGKKSIAKMQHWTSFLRKQIQVRIVGSFKNNQKSK